ncbi:MAG: aminoglycoside phosphotransferase family protein [Kouleothrix sp.]
MIWRCCIGLASTGPELALLRDKLQSVEALLRRRLIGSELPFGWVHGDFWPGNLLVRPAGELSGIIDWDRALPGQLPLLDILHLFAYMRKMHRHIELGEAIVEYLLPAAFDAEEPRADGRKSLAVWPAGPILSSCRLPPGYTGCALPLRTSCYPTRTIRFG